MKVIAGLLTGASALILVWAGNAQQVKERSGEDAPEGVEVALYGPVHEAFGQPTVRRQGANPPVAAKPPEPITEQPPEEAPADAQWIPGYWAWEEERNDYLWVSGLWRVAPPGRSWVPGYWTSSDNGHVWVSGYWGAPEETQQLYPTPPDPVEEAVPPPPEADSVYIPGTWVYVDRNYRWRSGIWVGNRAGWLWTTPCYHWTPGGYAFVDGHWDRDFNRRGLLFAPVFVDQRIARRGGWSYRPQHVVYADFLLGSLWIHSTNNHFYFGDYFDRRYARTFMPWWQYRLADRYDDPQFAYYRWRNRDQADWQVNLQSAFTARQDGKQARPPRTWQQFEQGGGIKGNNRVAVTVNNFQDTNIKLAAASPVQIQQATKGAAQFRNLSTQRQKAENQPRVAKGAEALKLNLPLAKYSAKAKDDAPPAPKLPKLQPVPIGTGKTKEDGPQGKEIGPKGKDDAPKGKNDFPKGKDDEPKKDNEPKEKDLPKGKDNFPKGKDDEPKGKSDFPKAKIDAPKGGKGNDNNPPPPPKVDIPKMNPVNPPNPPPAPKNKGKGKGKGGDD